jgi:hypothetical protein
MHLFSSLKVKLGISRKLIMETFLGGALVFDLKRAKVVDEEEEESVGRGGGSSR